MQPMLFFRATATRARDIKRHLGSNAYVYSYRTGEKPRHHLRHRDDDLHAPCPSRRRHP